MKLLQKTSMTIAAYAILQTQPLAAQQADYPYVPVRFTAVRVTDAFWQPRMEINRTVTIPYILAKCRESGRVVNFEIAAGLRKGEYCGVYPFDDTDIYKLIEAASYSLSLHPDPALSDSLDVLIERIGTAQEPDGYLYTARTTNAKKLASWMGDTRWSTLGRSHELYDEGHMYEAAVAHFQATGKRSFLNIAIKNANMIASEFGPGKRMTPPGHEEIEIGLVKLYRVTGDRRYLDLAKFFLDERGRNDDGRVLWGEYAQDQKPILQQEELVGHAVRGLYMCAGIADVVALTGNQPYEKALDRLWASLVGRKLYVTGGVGSENYGESLGADFDLPNMSAYCETCASVANVLCNFRLFLLHGDGKYIDVMERTLFNALLAGVSLSGDRFFYPNPLASRGQHTRSPWFECACCPGNVARLIPSVPGYIYATARDSLFVNLFVSSNTTVSLQSARVDISQETDYPWNGDIALRVDPERETKFSVNIRIPGWAAGEPVPGDLYRFADTNGEQVSITVNGQARPVSPVKGYARILRNWTKGDIIRLHLPMPVRRVEARSEVAEDQGKCALQRGPLVYCLEWPDQPGGKVLNICLEKSAPLSAKFQKDLLGGVGVIKARGEELRYDEGGSVLHQKVQDAIAIPYFAWANRGPGEMAVWIPYDPAKAVPLNGPSIARGSLLTNSGGTGSQTLTELNLPANSRDTLGGYIRWTGGRDTVWAQYDFGRKAEVSEVRLFWLDDGTAGRCRVPKSWRILAKVFGAWEPVWNPSKIWGVETDRMNRVIFETVRTDHLRLEAVPQPGMEAGVLRWVVE